jgi:hypothetical protein
MARRNEWFKSSRSSGIDAKCVQVRFGDRVDVRDSQDPAGACFTVSSETWKAFISSVLGQGFIQAADEAAVDKELVRTQLDLALPDAGWRGGPDLEFALTSHGGATFAVLRQHQLRQGGRHLVFTSSEWNVFVAGIHDGEFDLPQVSSGDYARY